MNKITKTYRLNMETLRNISYLADITGHTSTEIVEMAVDALWALKTSMQCYKEYGNDAFFAESFIKTALIKRPELLNDCEE